MVFNEEEAWDGSIDKLVGAEVVTPHPEDEEDEQGTHGGQLTPHTPVARTPARTPITHEHGEPSSVGGRKGTRLEVSNESNLTLASLRNRVRGQKTRILRELYEQNDEVDQVSNFTFIACDPVDFDEDDWIKTMDEEIDSIERNNTWDLV